MFKTFHRYLKILLLQHVFGAGKDLSLRGNFIVTMIGSLCFFYLHLISFGLIISRFHFPGWSEGELWVLLFTFEIFTYLAFYLLWRGLNQLPREINRGTYDVLLTKPVNSRFISYFRNGSFHNLLSALLGLSYLIYTLKKYQLLVSFPAIFLYCFSLATSLWIFHCLGLIFTSINFRHGFIPGTSSAAFEIQEIFKYPADIFTPSPFWQKFLIYPTVLMTTIPTVALLTKPISQELILAYLLVFIIFTFLSHQVWSSALRNYSSASS